MKTILAGCGGISRTWLNSIKGFDGIQIAGLFDIKRENAEARKSEFALDVPVFNDLKKAIKESGAEIVFDCTVPSAHAEIVCTALSMGCHVLGEKPMADTMQNARKMLRAAEKNKRVYAVIQNRRYLGRILRFKNAIFSGQIGKLTTLNVDFYLAPHFGGFRDEMKHVLLLDMAIHTFDSARFLSGLDPVSVYCADWNPSGSWYRDGASAYAVFEFEGGVIFNYRGSWCAEGCATPWEGEWRAIGEKGTVKWDGAENVSGQYAEKSSGFSSELKTFDVPPVELKYEKHAAIIREFAECVKSGRAPQTVCTDNIKSLAMVHAAIKSAETGRKIRIKY